MIDVYRSDRRAADDAAEFFRRALASTGVTPQRVATDKAACYRPALAEVLPEAEHATGKLVQQRIERDHQHFKGRLHPMRGFKTGPAAQVVCGGHGFLRNLQRGFYRLGLALACAGVPQPPLAMRAWDELAQVLLAG